MYLLYHGVHDKPLGDRTTAAPAMMFLQLPKYLLLQVLVPSNHLVPLGKQQYKYR